MRGALVQSLLELAETDERVWFLTGDLGFSVVEPLAERFPDRFVNVGVAEQNMVGIATGLAEGGLIPYVYSIATFASLRPYEFIRNGPVLHDLPVRIVGVGGGFEYGDAGPTHHSVEDVAVMRALPGLTVLVPADFHQACTAVKATYDLAGPIYLRLGKDDRVVIPELGGRFALGRTETLRPGRDLAILPLGPIALEAMAAAEELSLEGVDAAVEVVSTLHPTPTEDLIGLLGRFSVVVTVEAHSVNGGLGSMVCEVAAEAGMGTRVMRCGVRTRHRLGGSEQYLLAVHGVSRDGIVQAAKRALVMSDA